MVKHRRKTRTGSGKTARTNAMGLLWDGPAESTRGPKADLTLHAIVQAGLLVVDAEGLSALTMVRVADELGVTPMATYRHVRSKEELLDLMIDAAFGDAPRCSADDWRRELTKWARAELALFRKRPWLLQTVLQRVAMGPKWTAWLDAALTALSSTSLRGSELFAAVTLVDAHVRAAAQIFVGAPGAWAENFNYVLGRASHDPRFTGLARAIEQSRDKADESIEGEIQDQFEFGLERILDGVEALLRTRDAGDHKRDRKRAAKQRARN
jgi:AcrR family transcriptional regulator